MPRGRKPDEVKARVEPFYAHVGNYVTRARLDADLTQQALGTLVGLTRTSIANLEAGRQKISAYTLWRIAEALQLSPAALCPPVRHPATTQGQKLRMVAYPQPGARHAAS
jgi:transcriptional regulator with XRE-family HTH domain